MIKEIWLGEYNRTHDLCAADAAVFDANPGLQQFKRLARRGDGPPDNSWIGQEVTVMRCREPSQELTQTKLI